MTEVIGEGNVMLENGLKLAGQEGKSMLLVGVWGLIAETVPTVVVFVKKTLADGSVSGRES